MTACRYLPMRRTSSNETALLTGIVILSPRLFSSLYSIFSVSAVLEQLLVSDQRRIVNGIPFICIHFASAEGILINQDQD